ncbi:MAG TPA: L,D-transpeptidase family protein [Anaerolineales bacterium]|nr:L,D-transpeptidase family protein [Anaerolineales bacterium]HNN14251.1 L,D-transpeptidase family protein [Anaerolineales bacterium]HNO30471.1 L,D-transpeptidase family protein [Anaerolineales bacterium]
MNNRTEQPQESTPSQPQGGESRKNGKPVKGPKKKRSMALPILLIVMGCAVFGFAAWSAVTSPVLASILNTTYAAPAQQTFYGQPFAQVFIPKPTYTPSAGQPVEISTPLPTPTAASTAVVEIPPTEMPTIQAAVLPEATEAQEQPAVADSNSQPEAVAEAAIVPDTPTPEYVAPTEVANVPPPSGVGSGEHWFDVDLSDQRMYAYEGDTLVRTFIVSTGTWQTPTVTGRFKVWIKLRSAPMSGPGYYLPDVPYIMYFYKDYGIHGTYWHNNFGVPMSHGCVNLSTPDAEWAYNFASVGTVVNVHD